MEKYTTGAIGYQKHLYTQTLSGRETDEFERWIDKNYESPAKDSIDRVVTDKRLTKDDWDILIRFLALQDVRTPARLLEHLDRGRNTHEDTLREVIENLKVEMESNNTRLLEDASVNSKDYDKHFPLKVTTELNPGSEMGTTKVESYIGRSTWIHSMKALLINTEQILHKHKWSIIKPAIGYSWFTSDNPVIKLNYTNDNEYDFGGSWGRNKGNIIFPIGPQHAMFVQIGDRPIPKGTRLTVPQTIQLRKFIAEHAHRKIFSDQFDDEVPSIRPRHISSEKVKFERSQLENWHRQNNELESEFFR